MKKKPPVRNGKDRSSIGSDGMMPCAVWREKELDSRKSITGNAEPREPALTLSLTLWGGANMSGPGKVHMRVLHGLGTCGAPAPWVTNS